MKTRFRYASLLVIATFVWPLLASAQTCFQVSTKDGVSPAKQFLQTYDGESACYVGNGCDGNLKSQDTFCNIICTEKPDTLDSQGNVTNPCMAASSAPKPQQLTDARSCSYTAHDGSRVQECSKDPNYCSNNIAQITPGTCACVTDTEKCPPTATTAPPTKTTPPPVLINPLGTTDVAALIARAIKLFTGISGSIALLMFVYGGFLWVTSAGNSDKVKQGQKVFVSASLGLIIIFTAYIIIATIFKVLSGTSI